MSQFVVVARLTRAACSPGRRPCSGRRRAAALRGPAPAPLGAPRRRRPPRTPGTQPGTPATPAGHAAFRDGGTVDHAANGFDPHEIAARLRLGQDAAARRAGRVLREWELVAIDKEIEIAPGVRFAAWTYNGRIPGPTLRCREGERLRITFVNGSAHPHTIHFHGIHPAAMDGVPGHRRRRDRSPAGTTVYEFDALPVRPAPLPLPRPPARRAHRQGPLRRVHHRPARRRARTPTSW